MSDLTDIGAFRLTERLAEGGMGAVYLGQHASGTPVAVKLLEIEDPDDLFARLFVREVEATARLHHENVVAILDYGRLHDSQTFDGFSANTPYYVMEFVPDGELDDHMPTDWPTLRSVLEQVLAGLAHAHGRGVVHRDIKPANILVDDRYETRRYLLTDFGIAHATDTTTPRTDLTGREGTSGTPLYMSPEQFMGNWRDFGPWTDIYALATVSWHLASGKPPFRARSFVDLGMQHIRRPLPPLEATFEVPDHFHEWLGRAAAKEPYERFQSASEALAALTQSSVAAGWRARESTYRSARIGGAGLGVLGLRSIPMQGREPERDTLWDRLVQATEGRGGCVLLDGPPGAGTSRLARWLVELAGESGVARCVRVGGSGEGSGLSRLLHTVFGSAGLNETDLYERIEEVAKRLGVEAQPRLFMDLMSARGTELSAAQGFESAARLLVQSTHAQPLLLWIDDIDASAELSSFIEFIAPRLAEERLLIVGTHGLPPDERAAPTLARLRELDEVSALTLTWLSSAEMQGLIQARVALDWDVTEQLIEVCDGNPLFATQTLEQWAQSGVLHSTGEQLELSGDASVPQSLTDVWRERVDRLVEQLADVKMLDSGQLRIATPRESTRSLLAVAAHLGVLVDDAEWAAVCSELGLRLRPFLSEEIVRLGLGHATATGFEFAHRPICDVLREETGKVSSAEIDSACATVLARMYGSAHAGLSLRIARHLHRAGAVDRAAIAARHAAEQARRSYDVVSLNDAVAIWEASISARPSDILRMLSMKAYGLLLQTTPGSRDSAAAVLERAEALVAQVTDPNVVVGYRATTATAALYLGEPAAARDRLRDVISKADDADTLTQAWIAIAHTSAAVGEVTEMLEAASRATELAPTSARRMQALQVLGRARLEAGHLDEARTTMDAAATLAREGNWVLAEARGDETRAFIADASGEYARAVALHRRALELFELVAPRTSYPDKQREYLARALMACGQFDDARRTIAVVRAGIDGGKVGFYTHIEDLEMALAAVADDWATVEAVVDAALDFPFPAHELHRRAIALTALLARATGREQLASRLHDALASLGDGDEVDRAQREARQIRERSSK